MDRKPANAKIVICEPDHECCLMTAEKGLYSVGGLILFTRREALVQVLQRLGITVDGDDVWL